MHAVSLTSTGMDIHVAALALMWHVNDRLDCGFDVSPCSSGSPIRNRKWTKESCRQSNPETHRYEQSITFFRPLNCNSNQYQAIVKKKKKKKYRCYTGCEKNVVTRVDILLFIHVTVFTLRSKSAFFSVMLSSTISICMQHVHKWTDRETETKEI